MKLAWITWEEQPRNKSMSDLVGADFYKIVNEQGGLKRYLHCIKNTIQVFKKDYSIVFVQNPSIVLAFIAVVLKSIFRKSVVIDAHNAGVYPKENKHKVLTCINFKILKLADYVIVTNSQLQNKLLNSGINAVVFTDPLPDLKASTSVIKKDYIFIICSWSADEPIQLYFEAARKLPELTFKMSGNHRRYTESLNDIPSNVELLGFIDKAVYEQSLLEAALVVDLTIREDCLVCGAYEAISAENVIVLTDNEVNRDVFKDCAIYSRLNTQSLIESIRTGINQPLVDFAKFKRDYRYLLEQKKSKFLKRLSSQ